MSIRSNVDRAGLDQRVAFLRVTPGQDAGGFPTGSQRSLGEVWARVDGMKAGDRYQDPDVASGVRTVSSMTVWIRADVFTRLGLTTADKAVWKKASGDVALDILDIPDQQLRGRLIAVICRAGLNNG